MIYLGGFIILVLAIIMTLGWLRATVDRKLHSESFRDSTKLGITITTLAFPLMLAAPNYFDNFYFWSIIILLSISTFLGLWNNFSIATLADEEGKIKVGPNNNTIMPTLLVLQFLFMIYAIVVAVVNGKKPEEKIKPQIIYIPRHEFQIGDAKKQLLKFWGVPNSEHKIKDTTIFYYEDSKSVTHYKIYQDSIIEINERKITSCNK